MKRNSPSYFRFVVVLSVITFIAALVFSHSYLCSSVQAFCEPSSDPAAPIHTLAPRYLEYSQAALEIAQSQGVVVLYFWAPWCSSCSTLDLDIQKNPDLIPKGVTVLRIDYDHAGDLRQKYQVVTQHTFVQIDRQGNALATWVGGDTKVWNTHIRQE